MGYIIYRRFTMTDEQCMEIVDAIKELTFSVNAVAENIDNISSYYDGDLRKELRFIGETLHDIKEWKL
jgi:hypothetical protein